MALNILFNAVEPGSGTSTITANLALLAASRGYRVCLVDTHFDHPTVHLEVGADESYLDYALNHYLKGQCNIQQATYDITPQLPAEMSGRLFLCPANLRYEPVENPAWSGYDLKLLEKGLAQLTETLSIDLIMIDTSAGLNAMTLAGIDLCQQVVVITSPGQKTYLDNAETPRKPLDLEKISFIINAIPAENDLQAVQAALEAAFKRPVIATLPQVADIATEHAQAFVIRQADHLLTQQLIQSIDKLLGDG